MNKVYGGTRSGNSLCASCSHSLIIKGDGFSQEASYCNYNFDNRLKITFPVVECNQYKDKNTPSLSEFTKIAWAINADPKTGKVGFLSGRKLSKDDKNKLWDEASDNNPLDKG